MSEHDELHRIESIEERQQALRRQLRSEVPGLGEDDPIFAFAPVDPQVYARSCESLVGQVAIPVGVVGPLRVHYRDYRENEQGELVENGAVRSHEFFIPMATHEGGLNASLNRGIKAANECGGVSTYVLQAAMTRGSCYVFETTEHAYLFSKWIKTQLAGMKGWLEDPDNPFRDAVLNGIPLLN